MSAPEVNCMSYLVEDSGCAHQKAPRSFFGLLPAACIMACTPMPSRDPRIAPVRCVFQVEIIDPLKPHSAPRPR